MSATPPLLSSLYLAAQIILRGGAVPFYLGGLSLGCFRSKFSAMAAFVAAGQAVNPFLGVIRVHSVPTSLIVHPTDNTFPYCR
jgi:hypothetical protein